MHIQLIMILLEIAEALHLFYIYRKKIEYNMHTCVMHNPNFEGEIWENCGLAE